MLHRLYSYWKTYVRLLLIFGLASAEVCNQNSQHQCEEDGKCIPIMGRCNGTPDCKYGSDESFAECKAHLNDSVADMFYCASGILMIDEQLCNNVRDCPDGSDELPQLCEYEPFGLKFRDLNIQGKCRSSEIECLPGECVPENKKCDGRIDCSNGRDESLELCLDSCRDCFKCANGVAINSELVCDNKIDCLDGSDELRNVCQGNSKSWIETLPAICIEPPDGKHRFTDNTMFSLRKETRFVYPNQPAELQCQSSNQTAWNVCMKDGSWNRELPSCTTMPKYVNRNPDTNGTNGCQKSWYRKAFSYVLSFTPWSQENSSPRCTKLCRPEDLTKIASLIPTCYNGKDGSSFNCNDENSLIPDTSVKFRCTEGFMPLTDKEYYVTCNENGIWEGLQELSLKQDKLCTYQCIINHATSNSANGVSKNSHHASWVVCVVNFISLNIVLTAGQLI